MAFSLTKVADPHKLAARVASWTQRKRTHAANRIASGLVAWSSGLTVNTGSFIKTAQADGTLIAAYAVISGGTTTIEPLPNTLAVQNGGGGSSFQLIDNRQLLTLTIVSP